VDIEPITARLKPCMPPVHDIAVFVSPGSDFGVHLDARAPGVHVAGPIDDASLRRQDKTVPDARAERGACNFDQRAHNRLEAIVDGVDANKATWREPRGKPHAFPYNEFVERRYDRVR